MCKRTMGIVIVLLVGLFWVCIGSGHSEGHHERVVFDIFPTLPVLFLPDLRPYVEQIQQKHGQTEWEVIVLTNEFHRHLGIYSILGAKMGLRARDYFQVGLDEMAIRSYAGSKPPVSCLNDGLQVSTGATLGHGTISIASNQPAVPHAEFTHGSTTIRIQLKPSYTEQIKNDIRLAIQTHGPKTPSYWQQVRKLGIHYWLKWSRNDLFSIEKIRE